MLQLDLIGLIITVLILGPQNILYIFVALLIHEIGRIAILALITPQIEVVVTGGILNSTVFAVAEPVAVTLLTALAGPFFCIIIGLFIGGINKKLLKSFSELINPFTKPGNPWAVINFRFAILSASLGIIKLFDTGFLR